MSQDDDTTPVTSYCPDCAQPVEFRLTNAGSLRKFCPGSSRVHLCRPTARVRFQTHNCDVLELQNGAPPARQEVMKKVRFTKDKVKAWRELREG